MKRFLLAVLFVCCASFAYAQKPTQDVVYLKNGSVVKGVVLPSAEGTIKIQTRDGSIFVYNLSDVESKQIEQVTKTVTGKKILDLPKHSFGIRGGALFSRVPSSEMLLNPQNHLVYTEDYEPEYEYLHLNGAGFYIGGVYEVALTKTNRWFFQTGLDFQYINSVKKKDIFVKDLNSWNDVYWNYKNLTVNSLFIDIPMMFSCKFPLNKGYVIYPSFGLTHTIGLFSRLTGEREQFDLDYNYRTGEVEYTSKTGESQSVSTSCRGVYGPERCECPHHLIPYAKYSLNFKGEVNFAMPNNFVLGVSAAFALTGTNGGLFDLDSTLLCNVGLSVGYNF